MGLTESNQSKSGFWGATKSKSTSHFLDGRSSYEAKPRQASTLPARTVPHEQGSPVLLPSSKRDGNLSSLIRGRSPDRRASHRNRSLQREPTPWKEARNARPSGISQAFDHKIQTQSNHFLDLPASSIDVPPIRYSPIQINGVSRSPPLSPKPNSASSQPQLLPTARSASDAKGCLNRQLGSFRSSQRHGVCNRKELKDEESPVSGRKQPQTPSPFTLSMTSCADPIISASIGTKDSKPNESLKSREFLENNDYSGVLERVYLSKDLDNATHIQKNPRLSKKNEGYCEIRRKKTLKASEKKIGIVSNTSSVVESDPYLCLFFNTNCHSVQENHTCDDEVETSRSSIYSKASPSVPNETVASPDRVTNSPLYERSQIIITVDDTEMGELDHSEPKKAIELFSNVCLESKGRTNEVKSLEDSYLTQSLVREKKSARLKRDSDPCSSIASAESITTNNESRNGISGTEPHFISPSFNGSFLNNKEEQDSHTKIPQHDSGLSNEGNMFLNGNGNLFVALNNHEDKPNGEKPELLTCYNIPATLSTVPELWPTDCNDESEQEILHEDKSIPIPPSLHVSQSLVSNCPSPNNRDTKITASLESEKPPIIKKIVNDAAKISSVHSSVSLFATMPSCQNNMAKISTLPSPSGCPSSSREFDLTGNQSQYTKFRRNTIHSLDGGVYPILRLPKSDSQPRLVDVLKKKEERDLNYDPHRDSLPLLYDPLLAETRIGTGLKYSPLDENILYIAEGEFDKPLCHPSHKNNESSQISFPNVNKLYSSTVIGNFAVNTMEEDLAGTGHSLHVKSQASVVEFDHQEIGGIEKTIRNDSFPPTSPFSSLKPKNKTFPHVINSMKSHHLSKSYPSSLKTSQFENSHNCSLTCHEQCQNVVSLDCKIASSDEESLLENDFPLDPPSEEIGTFDQARQPPHVDLADEKAEESLEKEENQESETEKNEPESEENAKESDEEEKVVAEKEETPEKNEDVLDAQDYSTLKKSEEASTLRRTVYRIQSQAVDSAKIEEWVRKCPLTNVGLQIAKELDGGYRGCLRIHLNLCRPINIVAGTRPPSIYDILQEDRTMEKTLTSFYMPRDAVKAIHITSKTTTREVIVALLRKFKVVDNPHKFALYERTYDAGQSMRAKLRRLSDSECPLVLAIAWNAQGITNKRLVLQENDTADIQWEAFSLPELANFLRILDREEGEYKNQIKDKYALLRQRIQSQLARIAPVNT